MYDGALFPRSASLLVIIIIIIIVVVVVVVYTRAWLVTQ